MQIVKKPELNEWWIEDVGPQGRTLVASFPGPDAEQNARTMMNAGRLKEACDRVLESWSAWVAEGNERHNSGWPDLVRAVAGELAEVMMEIETNTKG